MKQVHLYCLTFILCFSGSTFAQKFKFNYHTDFKKILKRTQNAKDTWYYPKQLERFQKNDTTLTSYEVLGLMIGYTADTNYQPYDDIKVERKVYWSVEKYEKFTLEQFVIDVMYCMVSSLWLQGKAHFSESR